MSVLVDQCCIVGVALWLWWLVLLKVSPWVYRRFWRE